MGHDHSHAAGRAEDRARLRWCWRSPRRCWWSSWSARGSPGRSRCSPTPGTWPPTPPRSCSRWGRRTSPPGRPGRARRSACTAPRSSPRCVNALVLLGVCGYLAYAGISRLADPTPVDAGPMVGFALVGLVANAVSLAILNRSETGSLNLRGAANEVFADLLGSVLAVAAGVVICADRLRARRPDRLAGDRGADPAAVAAPAAGLGGRCCSRSPPRASTSTTCATTSRRARRRRRARPARLDDHQRDAQPLRPRHRHRRGAGRDGVGGILDRLCRVRRRALRRSTTRRSRSSPRPTRSTRTWARCTDARPVGRARIGPATATHG